MSKNQSANLVLLNPSLLLSSVQPNVQTSSIPIRPNVGGRTLQTTRKTLHNYPDSFLARMFDPSNSQMLQPEADDSIFIDRDPNLFIPILQFYRTGQLDIPKVISRSALIAELDFYALTESVVDAKPLTIYSNNASISRFKTLIDFHDSSYLPTWIEALAHRAAPVLRKSIARGAISFSITITASAACEGVPPFLQQDVTHLNFWQDFAAAVIFVAYTTGIPSFIDQFCSFINENSLLQVRKGEDNAVTTTWEPLKVELSFEEDGEIISLRGEHIDSGFEAVRCQSGWRFTWDMRE
ncbi:hypothetical protein HDV00_003576 [Rhizophlyctis rosea]|nr:hypothetical protein HDV00_003576 [Rhizophlyctis rosea]